MKISIQRLSLRAIILTMAIGSAFALGLTTASSQAATTSDTGISTAPRLDTLRVVDGEVLDTTVVGSKVILAGTFTQLKDVDGTTVNQPYLAAYDITTGNFDANFRPELDKYAIAVSPAENNVDLYIGGNFTTVNNQTHRKVAKLSLDGTVDPDFDTQIDANVNDLEAANGKLYIAGRFTSVDGLDRAIFTALDAQNGDPDPNTNFDFTFSVASAGAFTGKSLGITPDGSKLFLSHTARYIDGQERTAIARFNLTTGNTVLASWQTDLYDDELDRFGGVLRPRRVAISPDGSYVVLVTSGGDRPPAGDTAVKFPTIGGEGVQADWVSRHFDTVLGVAISDTAVFVGGHFQYQEAAGSTDPYPGDKLTNYGFGFGQGPAQLGAEVVARQQLGALNPATGKTLDWNPGSDSFLGVQSLTYVDDLGLLVGHDGSKLGGADIGRHALFPAVDQTPIELYACTVKTVGDSVTVNFNGTRGWAEHLQRNGSWYSEVTEQNNASIDAGADSIYSVRVYGPEFAKPFQEFTCLTDTAPVALDTTIASPVIDQTVAPGQITISGNASTPAGIKRVRLTVIHSASGEYLNEDGSFTTQWAPLDVDIDSDDQVRDWTKTITLTRTGEFNLTAKTMAQDDTKDETRAESSFRVGSLENDPPEIAYTSPTTTVTSSAVQIAGTASDDLGVSSVSFLIRNQENDQYLRPDGTVGAAQRFTATLANPGAQLTTWSADVSVPIGQWQITADAYDSSGQRARLSRNFAQVGDALPPTISLTAGRNQKIGSGFKLRFAGNAQAEAGIDSVAVLIRNSLNYNGIQANGAFGVRASYFALPNVNEGNSETFIYTTPSMPTGTYDVIFRVYDSLGATSFTRTTMVVGTVGDDLPTATILTAERWQQGFDNLDLSISGTASDDNGLQNVSVMLRNITENRWLLPDGSYDTAPAPLSAQLTSPGSTQSDWNLELSVPDPGLYYVYVRAVDSSGQTSLASFFGSAKIFPGDERPTVEILSPATNITETGDRIFTSGEARDDVSVQEVDVLVRNLDTSQYVRIDGSLGSVQWIPALLTNAGGQRTNWDFQTGSIPSGRYSVTVRTTDSNDQTSATVRVVVTIP